MFDPMSELDGSNANSSSAPTFTDRPQRSRRGGSNDGNFAEDIHSVSIHAEQRTFYIDLKESSHGKFLKVSEKSRGGRKTTIMLDCEDIDKFIAAFEEMKTKL